MKRIIIICEGQTEQEFTQDVLQPHFTPLGISLGYPTILKSGGGIVAWSRLKKQIETHLKQDKNTIVSTFIDYYGLQKKHQFPNWKAHISLYEQNKFEAIDLLEKGMKDSLEEDLQHRFIPYIQLHEFEALMFCKESVFDDCFKPNEFLNRQYLTETIKNHNTPEHINNHPSTAPSKRLAKILKAYQEEASGAKRLYGSMIAEEIGLDIIREKCLRFNSWITKIEKL